MATNNVIELIVKTVDQATAPLRNIEKEVGKVGSTAGSSAGGFSRLTLGVGVAVTAIAAAGLAFKKYISDSSQAEQYNLRFGKTFEAFKDSVGISRTALNDFASEMRKTTTYTSDSIKEMQLVLLRFGNITGSEFKRAEAASLDLSAALGVSLPAAVNTVGDALSRPEAALKSLQSAGVVFSASQKELIKNFVDTGQTARAQGLILDELEKRYGGTAKEAVNTFAGAMSRLGNSFGELFKMEGDISVFTALVNKMADALDRLSSSRSDNEFKDLQNRLALAKQGGFSQKQIDDLQRQVNVARAARTTEAGHSDTRKPVAAQPVQDTTGVSELSVMEPLNLGLQKYRAALKAAQDASKRASDEEQAQIEVRSRGFDEAARNYQKLNDQIDNELIGSIEKLGVTLDEIKLPDSAEHALDAYTKVMAGVDAVTQSIKDGFDDMVKNGKLSFSELVRFVIAELAKRALTNAIDGLAKSVSGALSASTGSGIGSKIFGFLGGLLGGGKAGGGMTGGLTRWNEEPGGELAVFPNGTQIYNKRQMAFNGIGGSSVNFQPQTAVTIQARAEDAASLRQEFAYMLQLNNQNMQRQWLETMRANGFGRLS